jgi:sortase A
MVAYVYLKKPPKVKNRAWPLFLSVFSLSFGTFLLFLVAWPIITFQTNVAPKLENNIISPIPPEEEVLGSEVDLARASNWFPGTSQNKDLGSKITSYNLSIPKLGIADAVVTIGGEDLSKSLIQWAGTALPGENGNGVIFGHSVLPAFYNPKNYTTIFSTLPTLKEGDEILIYFDGITYVYKVFELDIIEPADISVLEQKFDDSYVSLITCVPPGTYWKRLVVKAKLIKI